jgi:sporulation protein YlmC with PRC-barrel domain
MRGVLVLGLVAILSGYGLAAERGNIASGPSSYERSADAAGSPTPSALDADRADLKRVSRVLHAPIKDPYGANLGQVHDIVLAPDLNSVSYIALSRGGVLGVGNTLYAVPWSALSAGVNGKLVASITEEQLKQSRGFRPAYWPSEPQRGWVMEGEEPTYRGQTIEESRSVHDRRFTRIQGTPVKAADGQKTGTIQDLVVAMDSGNIAYTIVSYGGVFGLGQRFAAVPQDAITLEPALKVARIDASRETLRANSFTPGQWPALANPTYSQQLARAFNVEPSGTVLGFVPAEGPVAAAPKPGTTPRPERQPQVPPVTPAPAMAEPGAAELTGTFSPATITTIEGTVMDTGKFKATATGPDMLWLRVRTDGDQITLVNLGPRDYISGQDFYIVRGDRLRLVGSQVSAQASGKQVFLPTELTYNGHTLRLRSETGAPLWEGRMMQEEQPARSQIQPGAAESEAAALGYLPAEERAAGRAARAGRAAEAPMTQFAPAGIVALGAIDLSSSRTIEGTVTEVGKSHSAGGPDVVWLRIRTTDGQIVNVQVGPRDYVSRQNFFVVNGDRVRLTGWNARITDAPSATPVFVLADISQNGSVLQLRNRNGEPLWTAEPGAAERQRSTLGQTPTERTTPSSEAAGTPQATERDIEEPSEP